MGYRRETVLDMRIPRRQQRTAAQVKRSKEMMNMPKNTKVMPMADESDCEDCGDSLADIVLKFMQETSFHGLKFVTETRRHSMERVFWVITLIGAWAFGGYMIYKVIHKWKTSPVLVSFDSVQTGIYSIPFPTMTVCNMNKIRKSRVESIEAALQADPTNKVYKTEMRFVEEICASHEAMAALGNESTHSLFHSEDGDDLELTGDDLHHYLADLGNPCDEMLLRCHFEGSFYNCTDIFTTTITDEGQCCSFNIMPESVMFTEMVLETDEKEEEKWSAWTMQNGYANDPDPHATEKEMPLRALSPGLHMGLSVLLDLKEHEYYCSGTESVGFKVLLHTPISMPEMIQNGFAISPGTEAFLAVTPVMIHADEAIHGIDYNTRGCYLEDEKELAYFKHYSFLNCFAECSANFTFEYCGCVAYYMPRQEEEMLICAPEKSECVDEALIIVAESAYDDSHATNTECRCLPACTDMEFNHESSFSTLRNSNMLQLPNALKESNPEYQDDEYVRNNLAIIHAYFKNLHFMRQERGELYGFVDLFSNVGGLMGLCMGFSALSAVEIVYFLLIRFFFNLTMPRQEEF